MTAAHVLVTVWCGQCVDEGRTTRARRSPARLGTLRLDDGRKVWHSERDRRRLRTADHRMSDDAQNEVIRSAPPTVADSTVRDALAARGHTLPPSRTWFPANCPVHGSGSVSASDVVNASGNVVLKIRATA